jgi:hypothetical protein
MAAIPGTNNLLAFVVDIALLTLFAVSHRRPQDRFADAAVARLSWQPGQGGTNGAVANVKIDEYNRRLSGANSE